MSISSEAVKNIIKRGIDIHVHADPSLFPRWGDAWDLAMACRNEGMSGFVLKFHHGSSVETAAILDRQFPDLHVYGGITLNRYVGGLNPAAVDAAINLGARFVWLPTVHAHNHGKVFGHLGSFGFQQSSSRLNDVKGISILDDRGKLVPSLKEILHLMDNQPIVLATGHIAEKEIVFLHRYIRANQQKIRFLVNHVEFKVSALSIDTLNEMIDDLTWFETTYFSICDIGKSVTPAEVAQKILAVSQAKWIMASDTGQKANLKSPQALVEFAKLLMEKGITRTQVERMLISEPRNLLEG